MEKMDSLKKELPAQERLSKNAPTLEARDKALSKSSAMLDQIKMLERLASNAGK
ncbi:MAG: hypothetical protein V7772_06095 [Pseudomonas profundi]|uniref:hypothetical protein n=1 Tax=Pseudomonas profundi TaxID=1981513 RepID=UPI0030012B66